MPELCLYLTTPEEHAALVRRTADLEDQVRRLAARLDALEPTRPAVLGSFWPTVELASPFGYAGVAPAEPGDPASRP